jgi:uncharacterized protein (TIRG00374 family)
MGLRSVAPWLLFMGGLLFFGYLLNRFGVSTLVHSIATARWSLVGIVGLWVPIYLLNTTAWWLLLGPYGQSLSYGRLLALTLSGFALNYATPLAHLGGEPYKAYVLRRDLGMPRAIAAVVVYRMVHMLGHMLMLISGTAFTLLWVPLPPAVRRGLSLSAVGLLALALFIVSRHRRGLFTQFFGWLIRNGFIRRLTDRWPLSPDVLGEMDDIVTHVYRRRLGRFIVTVLLEYLSRLLMVVEVYLALRGIGIRVSPLDAVVIHTVGSIVINVLFVVPFSVGVQEAGFYVILPAFRLDPLVSVYISTVMRLRELVWILVGLGIAVGLGFHRLSKE